MVRGGKETKMQTQKIAANAAEHKAKISCPSFETVKQEVERIMRDQHLGFRGAIALARRDHRFRDLAERLGFGACGREVA
jgi:hypothetical protein